MDALSHCPADEDDESWIISVEGLLEDPEVHLPNLKELECQVEDADMAGMSESNSLELQQRIAKMNQICQHHVLNDLHTETADQNILGVRSNVTVDQLHL